MRYLALCSLHAILAYDKHTRSMPRFIELIIIEDRVRDLDSIFIEQIDLCLSSSMLLHHHGVSFHCDKKQLFLHQLVVQDCSEFLDSRVKD